LVGTISAVHETAIGARLLTRVMEVNVRAGQVVNAGAAAKLGAVRVIIDPIFSELAWTLIFGLFASTLFTLFVIPVAYWLLYANTPGHGAAVSPID
jgi:hypothetical protein